MAAVRPELDLELVGDRIRLVPLAERDLPELHAALGRAETFAAGYGGGPAPEPDPRLGLDGFVAFMAGYLQFGRGLVLGVRIRGGASDGALVGTTTLGDFDERRESAHLGWTAYHPAVWGTVVNPEAKLLLLGAAFDHGYGRVKLQADARNVRSRAAIERLGARFEGIARRDSPRADGSWRDAAIHSILADEWPQVRARLIERVAEWGDRAVELPAR